MKVWRRRNFFMFISIVLGNVHILYIKDASLTHMLKKKHVEFNDTPSYDTDPRTVNPEPAWRDLDEKRREHRVSILKNLLLALLSIIY